jgi:acyl carrier protein
MPSRPSYQENYPAQVDVPGHRVSEDAIIQWLIWKLSEVVEIEPQHLDIRRPFEHFGLDSIQAVSLSGDLADWLGREISPTVTWDYPTIELLARHLAAGSAQT